MSENMSFDALDVTERKSFENALRKSEQWLKTIIAASPLAILAIDEAGRIVSWSDAAERIFGWSEEESIGMVCPTVPPDGLQDFHDMLARVIHGETFSGLIKCRRKKDGTFIPVSLSSAPLCNGIGEAREVIVILEDISERKQAEADKEELMNELTDALYRLKILSGIIPICSYCKKIRNDQGYWEQLEGYITNHSEALFSHCMCADCEKKAYEELEKFKEMNKRM